MNENDIIYCDPPYIVRHADYFTSWNISHEKELYSSLKQKEARFILSTWHSNKFRTNDAIENIWKEFALDTKEHFYFVGGKEDNRNSMSEALIFNLYSNMVIKSSSYFDKRCKLMEERGYYVSDLKTVLKRLIEKKLLPSNKDNKWHGSYKKKRNMRELHIKPNRLLLYYIKKNSLFS